MVSILILCISIFSKKYICSFNDIGDIYFFKKSIYFRVFFVYGIKIIKVKKK